jgi:tetratricopeptide (TPR) repeat protein
VNPVWALPLLIAMQTRSASVSPRPIAWAAQSPRPLTCLAAPGLWEVSRQSLVERHCRELSRAQALLLRAPEQALARASALLAEAPTLAEARVLRGRASLRVGNSEQALSDLLPLIAEGAAPVADPAALLDGGRAALGRADLTNAARFYRQLGSRAALLPDRAQQVIAYVEIAAVLLASETAPMDDVLAYLREARRRAAGSGYTGLVVALTAATWIAHGREAEGQGVLAELSDPWALRRFETRQDVWLAEGVMDAVLGLALEREKGELSATHYRALATGPLASKALGKIGSRRREAGKRGGK